MPLKSKSKMCRLHKKSRMELGCAVITLKSKSKVCRMQKEEQNGAGMCANDKKE